MNERTKELAQQAWRYADDNSRDGDGTHGWLYRDKFAELIVRECAKVCIKKYYYSDRMSKECGINFAKDIKEHFGVEE